MRLPPIILHTHSQYSFLWKATISLLEKHASIFKIFWVSDTLLNYSLPDNFVFIQYQANMNWSERIKIALKEINDVYIFYIQEDWLLIDNIVISRIEWLLNFMEKNNVDFMMSYTTGKQTYQPIIKTDYHDYDIIKIKGHWLQPAVWKYTLFEKVVNLNISLKQLESKIVDDITESANCYSIVYNKNTYVSIPTFFFPHIHSIVNGEWTFNKYPNLKKIIESFEIDTTLRNINNTWLVDLIEYNN